MKSCLLYSLLTLGLFACESAKVQESAFYETVSVKPVNETKALPEVSHFVEQLISASERKDTAFVLNAVDDSVAISYGGGLYGKEAFLQEFIKSWNGFEKLKQVLELGGTIETDAEGQSKEYYMFPYVQSYKLYASKVPDSVELDPFLTAIGLDSLIPVYAKPAENATQKSVLSYPLLQLDPDSGYMNSSWAKVSTIDNKVVGFVKKDKFYISADITLIIQKKGNRYKIISVAPYD